VKFSIFVPMRLYNFLKIGLASVIAFYAIQLQAGDGGGPFINGKMLGSDMHEEITCMVKLANGKVAVGGWTDAFEPWATGGYQEVHAGTFDGFIAILSSDLQTVENFTFFGGTASDYITGIAEDPLGNIIVIGNTETNKLPTTIGALFPLYKAGVEGFLFAFSPQLESIKYGTYITGPKDEFPKVVKLDITGNIYVCGSTNSTYDFPTTNGYDKTHNGNMDAFLMKFAPGAAILHFSTYFGSDGTDEFLGMTVTKSGTILCTGYTTSGGYQTYPAVIPSQWWQTKDRPYDWTYNGGTSDAVLTVFSEDGAQLIVSTYYGGANADFGRAVVVDDRGRINLIGDSYSTDLPVNSGFQGSNKGGSDAFLVQFNETGRTLLASTYFGGDGDDIVSGAEYYNQDLFAIYGVSKSRNFPMFGGGSTNELTGGQDAFLALAANSLIEVSTFIGGNAKEEFKACSIGANGIITLAGYSTSESIQLGRGVATNNGARNTSDGFVTNFARGSENLVTPIGQEKFCIGQQNTISWSVVDMPPDESYSIDVRSSPDAEWITIAKDVVSKSYQWRPETTLTPSSQYQMRLRSSRGHDSRTPYQFTIYPAVNIVQNPISAVVCQGDTAVVSVEVVGAELRYTWKKDGNVMSGFTSASITIPNFSTENAGKYECFVQSVCGQSASSTAGIVSIGSKTSITTQPADVNVSIGSQLSISVTAVGSTLTYQWYKDGSLLPGKVAATLTVSVSTVADAGTYSCNVIGACGSQRSKDATVNVVTTSVNDQVENGHIEMWPQPADNLLTLKLSYPVKTFTVYSVQGAMVMEMNSSPTDGQIQIDCENFNSGLYTVALTSTSGVVSAHQFVVRH